jgi:hypothetical protein
VCTACVTTPQLLAVLSAFVSVCMHTHTQLLGGDFQSKLREAFDPAQLPVYLGGTRTGPEFA